MLKIDVNGLKELLTKYNIALENSFLTSDSLNIRDSQGRCLYREFYNRLCVNLSNNHWHIEEQSYHGDNDYNKNLSLNYGFVLYYDKYYIMDYYKDIEKNNTIIYRVVTFNPDLSVSEKENIKHCIEDAMGIFDES